MKTAQLGEFEEVVLLTVAVLYNDAYGIAIKKHIEEKLKRSVSVGALHSALRRLEAKSYLDSRLGESTPERGGKRKRLFTVSVNGFKALSHVRETRQQLWNEIPNVAFRF